MTAHFVLIDYENVQPSDLARLHGGACRVKVFLGAHQTKVPVTLAATLQGFGTRAEYVLLESAGSNALDFHIAYYIGVLSSQDPSARFHVVSKDTGFDPLLKHLELRGVHARRVESIAAVALVDPPPSATDAARVDAAVAHLARMKASKPRTTKTLSSTLNALFGKALSEPQVAALLGALCRRGVVSVAGDKVTYKVS